MFAWTLTSVTAALLGWWVWHRAQPPILELIRDDNGSALARLLHRRPQLGSIRLVGDALPLHVAASGGAVHATRVLLAHQVNPNARLNDGTTPLGIAAACGHVPVLVELIEYGASVDLADCQGKTALHRAAACGQLQAVLTLLEAWAHPNLMDLGRQTPLDIAKEQGEEMVIRALRHHGGAGGFAADVPAHKRPQTVRPSLAVATT